MTSSPSGARPAGEGPTPGPADELGVAQRPESLHVEVRGDGAAGLVPLVLVHGVLDSARSFSRLIRKLDSRRRVVTYDRRGYQRSRQAGTAPVVLDQHVDDLVQIVEGLRTSGAGPGERPGAGVGWSGAVVLGHSYGAVVALAAAARRPDVVAGVLAYEPPLSWLPWWPQQPAPGGSVPGGAASASDPPAMMPGDGEAPHRFAERFMEAMIGDSRYKRLSPSTRLGLAADGAAAVTELRDLASAPAFDPGALHVPVVVARGAHAASRHVQATDWLASAIPGAELHVVHGADHGAHLSHPGELARLLDALAVRVESNSTGRDRCQDG